MKYRLSSLLLLPVLGGCSMLPSFLGGGKPASSSPATPEPTGSVVPDTVNSVTALLHEYRWWALLGFIFFPQVRLALKEMLKAMFLVPTLLFQKIAEKLKGKDGA